MRSTSQHPRYACSPVWIFFVFEPLCGSHLPCWLRSSPRASLLWLRGVSFVTDGLVLFCTLRLVIVVNFCRVLRTFANGPRRSKKTMTLRCRCVVLLLLLVLSPPFPALLVFVTLFCPFGEACQLLSTECPLLTGLRSSYPYSHTRSCHLSRVCLCVCVFL